MSSNALSQSDVNTTTHVTTTGANNHIVARETFTLYGPCTNSLEVKFNATEGQRFHIQWTTTTQTELDFYIATPSFYIAPRACTLSGEPLYSISSETGSVDWVAPSTGQYVAWLVDSLAVTYGLGFFSIETSAISSQVSLTTSQVPAQITATPTMGTQQNAGFQVAFGNLGLLGVGAVVAVIASVLVFARKRKPSLAATLKQERPSTVQESPRDAVASQPITKPSVAAVLKQERPTTVQEPRRDVVSSQPLVQPKTVQSQPIISTGYVDLDNALQGGIPERFSVVIVSPSYDERDLLLRKVIESAVASGRLAILVSNDIGRTEDLTSRFSKGFYAFSPQADKIFPHRPNLFKVPDVENLSDANLSLNLAIKDVVAKESKPIIILDIVSDVLLRHKSITTRRWLSDFIGKRKAEGFTIIATLNPLTTTKEETQSAIDFFDGVIEIFEKPLMERSRRFLTIRKMYGRRYSENEVLMDKDKLF
jgi:KaiC/GvpD/RAD55 family RecA-like ATPase